MLLILPALTRRPSLVTGCHSFSSFLPPRRPPRRPPRPRPRSPPRSPPREAKPPPRGALVPRSAIFAIVESVEDLRYSRVVGRGRGLQIEDARPSFFQGGDLFGWLEILVRAHLPTLKLSAPGIRGSHPTRLASSLVGPCGAPIIPYNQPSAPHPVRPCGVRVRVGSRVHKPARVPSPSGLSCQQMPFSILCHVHHPIQPWFCFLAHEWFPMTTTANTATTTLGFTRIRFATSSSCGIVQLRHRPVTTNKHLPQHCRTAFCMATCAELMMLPVLVRSLSEPTEQYPRHRNLDRPCI